MNKDQESAMDRVNQIQKIVRPALFRAAIYEMMMDMIKQERNQIKFNALVGLEIENVTMQELDKAFKEVYRDLTE